MSSINRDPVLGIRKAVASGMMSLGMQPSKDLIDAVVDHLPDFFKQPLQAAEPHSDYRRQSCTSSSGNRVISGTGISGPFILTTRRQ